jgi:exodeoxyribonuclease V gamma subunit
VIAHTLNQTGLRLFTSNRLESLADSLAARLRSPPASPLQAEVVVVQSRGMARWLQLELARRLGVCANVRFPFPKAFVWDVFHALDPAVPEEPDFDPETLAWRVMRLLPELGRLPEFAPVRSYLERDGDGRKRYQLAQRIARLLDDYAIYRPEMITAWEAGEGRHWQAVLWRELRRESKGEHPVTLRERCLARLSQITSAPETLPPRVAVFGISALPPFYVELFDRLSASLDLNFFLLQPAKEYWGDVTSARSALRGLRQQGGHPAAPSSLHYHSGNRLLASLGHQGRDFLNVLLSFTDFNAHEDFTDPGAATVLAAIQSDILNVRDRGSRDCPPLSVAPEDDSVQIHCCHSPLRELEVLRDCMLDWFERDPGLAPRDVLVMVPEIEAYAPFVEAVFAGEEGDPKAIPFSIADRGSSLESHVISSFLALLHLAGGRLGAGAVWELIETPAIRRRFELEERDLVRIQEWLKQAGVRWGRDASHRASLELPALSENTWREGLDRLLLGYALRTQPTQLFHGILPCEGVEGQNAEAFGRFLAFIEGLFATLQKLETARPLADWVTLLRDTLDRFFAESDETERELRILRGALRALAERQEKASFEAPVSLAVVLEHLAPVLGEDHLHGGFLTGRVTFGALKPMRSIPFKVICLVGMNDTAFPRSDNRLGFDLMAKAPRLGDQSKREDDRYLFLETLLSARQRLYLSHVGQSIRDNSIAPPSVLVSELMDYIQQAFTTAEGKKVLADQICFNHRLQAFSRAYFRRDSRLFSYSEQNFRACQALRGKAVLPAFAGEMLPEPDEAWRTVELGQFAEFFAHPARFFARRRLGLRLPKRDGVLVEREPIELDGLENYGLKAELLERRLAAENLRDAFPLVKASGRLPLGQIGEAEYQCLCDRIERFHCRIEPFLREPLKEAPPIDMPLGKFRLTGYLPRVAADVLLQFRPAVLKPKDLVRAWVQHVVWNALPRDGRERVSILVGEETNRGRTASRFRPLADASRLLEELLELYWRGLREPLKFFPVSSLAFVKSECRNSGRNVDPRKDPLAKARVEWAGNDFRRGESDDEYFKLCFGGVDPLDEEFMKIARQVFLPMLEHEEPLP